MWWKNKVGSYLKPWCRSERAALFWCWAVHQNKCPTTHTSDIKLSCNIVLVRMAGRAGFSMLANIAALGAGELHGQGAELTLSVMLH